MDAREPLSSPTPLSLARESAGVYRTTSPQGTQLLGTLLGPLLEDGDLLVLSGDLGAGKTNLTKGVAEGLGVRDQVTSPTFTIQAVHEGDDLTLYHFDLYRLEDPSQLGDAGILDVAGVEGACLVEWGERFADWLGDERIDVQLTRCAPEAAGSPDTADGAWQEPDRRLAFVAHGARARALLDALDKVVVAQLAAAG